MEGKTRVTRRVGDRIEVGYTTSFDFDVYLELAGGSARYAYPSPEAAASDGWAPDPCELDLKAIPRFNARRRQDLV